MSASHSRFPDGRLRKPSSGTLRNLLGIPRDAPIDPELKEFFLERLLTRGDEELTNSLHSTSTASVDESLVAEVVDYPRLIRLSSKDEDVINIRNLMTRPTPNGVAAFWNCKTRVEIGKSIVLKAAIVPEFEDRFMLRQNALPRIKCKRQTLFFGSTWMCGFGRKNPRSIKPGEVLECCRIDKCNVCNILRYGFQRRFCRRNGISTG